MPATLKDAHWKVSGLGYLCCGKRIIARTHAVPEHVAESVTLDLDDAEYIAKACNAYPKLIAALRQSMRDGRDEPLMRELGEE